MTRPMTKLVGAHVSVVGGVHHSITHARHIGGTAFALFLKLQRQWESPPLNPSHVALFKDGMIEHGYGARAVLPHGSYLVNLGNPDKEKRERSYKAFLDDLNRCESLGLRLYNFHPGSTTGVCAVGESIGHIAECINCAHNETKNVICVLENMVKNEHRVYVYWLDIIAALVAGAGNIVGSKFEELGEIISKVKDKSRVGVCLDTCHTFAAGYDIRTPEAYAETMTLFARHIGFKFLNGLHLNDSKYDLGSRKDRHENIGKGQIGVEAFRLIMNDERMNGIPLILETPLGKGGDMSVWKEEIELLYGLVEEEEG
ncbi:xylose isomerase-like protein [Jimgerdemannia flammicorona]|uniref:Apurinic-apyrimidinic endonuclease 1 n=1 Tax=Jimgerdemannia flammicorona TaxID=994334 RepID=A0A433QKD0_9FUNG|nr:xylose isomerase-like protein [Jimgerdemannia flammicorona]